MLLLFEQGSAHVLGLLLKGFTMFSRSLHVTSVVVVAVVIFGTYSFVCDASSKLQVTVCTLDSSSSLPFDFVHAATRN